MARADLARINCVIVEILAVERPRLVADQAIFADLRRVELDLDLHVLGDRDEVRAALLHQHLLRFGKAVDVAGIAVAVLGEALHQRIVEIAAPKPQHAEEDPLVALGLDKGLERVRAVDTDIEVAVRRQDHPVHPVGNLVLRRQPVGELDPLGPGGRPARRKIVERAQDLGPVGRLGWFEHHAGRAGIDHDRHRIGRLQLVDQKAERTLQQRQLVGFVHRSRRIDQERQILWLPLSGGWHIALDADLEQFGLVVPRRRHHRHRRPERRFEAGGRRIVVGEVVDQLFEPHRVGLRQRAVAQHAPHIRVRCRVDVDRKG